VYIYNIQHVSFCVFFSSSPVSLQPLQQTCV